MVILWHPTGDDLGEALAVARNAFHAADEDFAGALEVLVVLPSGRDLALVDRINQQLDRGDTARLSLLIQANDLASISYALLRRLQGKGWTLAFAHRTDGLADVCRASNTEDRKALQTIETAIELAQKFRVDVDFLLTLPDGHRTPEDAARVFEFLAVNHVRRVSFAYPLLLSRLGLHPPRGLSEGTESRFFPAFLAAWRERPGVLFLDDLQRISGKLIAARAAGPADPLVPGPLSTLYFEAGRVYRNADGAVPELLTSKLPCEASTTEGPASESRARCRGACEFFPVCGGDFFGAKHLFNGTVFSADNAYCGAVAKPTFSRLLAL